MNMKAPDYSKRKVEREEEREKLMKGPLPMREDNPEGLHQRFLIRKIVGRKLDRVRHKYVLKTKAIEKNAEYFIMRMDFNGKDRNHIKACRRAIQAYADAIEPYIPELAKDIRERWPIEFKLLEKSEP